MTKWRWIFETFKEQLWYRTTLFCLAGIFTAALAPYLSIFIPSSWLYAVDTNSINRILSIMSNSMLIVTTFSLSTMVAAYSSTTQNITPRATRLLLADRISHTALSTFLGSFLFSLTSIIALGMDAYEEEDQLVLLIILIVVIVMVVGVLLRWIDYLSKLGRVDHTISKLENATKDAVDKYINSPFLGGKELKNYTPKKSHKAIFSDRIGFIQHIDMQALSEFAREHSCSVYIMHAAGKFNDGTKPVAYVSKAIAEKYECQVINAFVIDDDRSFKQDPRFGFIVLSEIASRALSPAVNDPGTAIDIIQTGLRLLKPFIEFKDGEQACEVRYSNVYMPALSLEDVCDGIFRPIARDGAHIFEVGVKLQKTFYALKEYSNKAATKKIVDEYARIALEHVEASELLPSYKKCLKKMHKDAEF